MKKLSGVPPFFRGENPSLFFLLFIFFFLSGERGVHLPSGQQRYKLYLAFHGVKMQIRTDMLEFETKQGEEAGIWEIP